MRSLSTVREWVGGLAHDPAYALVVLDEAWLRGQEAQIWAIGRIEDALSLFLSQLGVPDGDLIIPAAKVHAFMKPIEPECLAAAAPPNQFVGMAGFKKGSHGLQVGTRTAIQVRL